MVETKAVYLLSRSRGSEIEAIYLFREKPGDRLAPLLVLVAFLKSLLLTVVIDDR